MGPNDPVQGRLVKRPPFLFLLDKRARTYPVQGGLRSSLVGFDQVSACAMRVLGRARFKIRVGEFRELRRCRVFVVILLIDK